MGKIYKLSDKNGNVLYPMTIGDAIAVDGSTLTQKITFEATPDERGMMSAEDKFKLDNIDDYATANKGTVTEVTIMSGPGISVDNLSPITTQGVRTISLVDSGVSPGTYKSVDVDEYGRVTSGWNPNTLEGYGITDASIYDNGEIHLGGKTITPLTDGSKYVTLDGEQNLTHKTYNGYTLAAACAKAVDETTMSSSSTNLPTSKAVASYVGGAISGALVSVLKYQGTVTSTSGLPASHKVGYVYVVAEAGTYAGQKCEVGDYIICKTDGNTANNAHWDVINGENQVSNKDTTLNWNTTSTIATVDGTNITVKMPSNPVTVNDKNPTLSWDTKSTVATISGNDIHVTMPSNPVTVSNGNPTLSWGTKSKVATISGNDIHVTMPSNPAANKADKATTLAGYGITDASIHDNGTIELGGRTITPLTRHQDISGKQDKITAKGILKGNGNGSVSAAVAGKDYLIPEELDSMVKVVSPAVTNTEYTDSLIESIIKGA